MQNRTFKLTIRTHATARSLSSSTGYKSSQQSTKHVSITPYQKNRIMDIPQVSTSTSSSDAHNPIPPSSRAGPPADREALHLAYRPSPTAQHASSISPGEHPPSDPSSLHRARAQSLGPHSSSSTCTRAPLRPTCAAPCLAVRGRG